ncbi:MAG TPA: 3-oxoacid CoA-transferase subunit A [Acidimicrobiales bacterium]|jgi:3-oxoacid CoA-transferase A subunit|nr:3-oxoacid CoA-transferase subunit A [Acidimicrobiales bacterium]
MIDKTVKSADEALADVFGGASIHIGGFSEPASCPNDLLAALVRSGVGDLTIITNDAARGRGYIERMRAEVEAADPSASFDGVLPLPEWFIPVGVLVETGQVRRAITSAGGELKGGRETAAEGLIRQGVMEVELVSQGTLAERIRAGRVGMPAFYSAVGVGTFTTEGKEVRMFDGRPYVLETALRADFALIAADKADRFGNLTYRGSARTMNGVMAGAATVTIAEVNEIVAPEAMDPDRINTPGVYVDRVVLREHRVDEAGR